jgi:alkanesulfonate monooxygenase SsuD/methylene tetrahydromethanopterin reductase-like flavin-dependent oxidoreductase (luciferase family)
MHDPLPEPRIMHTERRVRGRSEQVAPEWDARAVTDLGVVFRPELPPEQLRAVASAAEEAGLAELWLWEDCFKEGGIAAAAAALAWTDRLRVGIGLLPVPLRNVALCAMEIATVARLFPGRFEVGVGHGVQDWMGQAGARVRSPLTLLGEYLTALHGLLGGETVTVDGRYVRLTDVRLDWPPTPAPRLFSGGYGRRTFELIGRIADGAIITGGTSPEDLQDTLRLIDQTRVAAGRVGDYPVTAYVMAATGADADDRVRRALALSGLNAGREAAATGDATAIAAVVRRYVAAGAHTVVLEPTVDEPDVVGFVRFVGREVQPLVRAA